MVVKIQHYKADSLPAIPQPNSIYWIKTSIDSEVSGYITDFQGIPYPLKDLDVTFNPGDYDLSDFNNLSSDPFLRASTGIQTIIAGTNITVDNTDPSNPIISSLQSTPSLQQVTDIGNSTGNGIQSINATGNAKFNISNGNYSEFEFFSQDISIDNFGVTEIRANPEGGVFITKQGGGDTNTIAISDSITLTSNDNNVKISSDELHSEKTIRTDENINFSGLGVLSSNATTLQNWELPDESGTIALVSDIPTKTSDLINDGDDGNKFISLLDLPSNLILYPTTVSSDVSGYFKMVTDIHDPSFNTTAVDVSTGAISGTAQLIASLVSSPGLINGNPGTFNTTTIGNITRTSGSGTAEFFFRVYKRDSSGVETLITQSANTIPVINTGYSEFSATGLWDDGIFLVTDRIVLKFYANRITGGSNPTYNFQFGGISPVRSLVPIPLSVVPSIGLDGLNDVAISTPLDAQVLGYETATSLWKNKSIATWLGFTPANDASVVHIAGTETITGLKTFSVDTVINGHRVGRGGGNSASNLMVASGNFVNTGGANTFLGSRSGFFNLSGNSNTIIGGGAGQNNTTGSNTTYLGRDSGRFIADGTTACTIANNSVFIGTATKPLADNQTNQIVIGYNSTGLGSNTTVLGNSSTLLTAVYGNLILGSTADTGQKLQVTGTSIFTADATINGHKIGRGGGNIASNIMIGSSNSLNTGVNDLFLGVGSGNSNTSGNNSVFIGRDSGVFNTTGSQNTFIGQNAGFGNTTGNNTTCLGRDSARFVADGVTNATIISNSVFLGTGTKPLADNQTNQIVIGYNSVGLGSNTTTIGNSSTLLTAVYGNLILGSTADTGQKLQVTGSAKIDGSTQGLIFADNVGNTSNFCIYPRLSPSLTNYMLRTDGNNTVLNASVIGGLISFRLGDTQFGRFFATSGNFVVQNSGTFTDIASARLQVNSTTQGFLPPRMTNAQRIAIVSPAIGLIVYCTDATEGVYTYKSTGWTLLL